MSLLVCAAHACRRLLYCHLLADWHLNVRLGRAAEAFARGLTHLISPGALRWEQKKRVTPLVVGERSDFRGLKW